MQGSLTPSQASEPFTGKAFNEPVYVLAYNKNKYICNFKLPSKITLCTMLLRYEWLDDISLLGNGEPCITATYTSMINKVE